LLFIQKYVHHRSKLPAVFSTYFEENKLLHCHILSKKNDLHRYAVQSEIGKKTVKYRASKIWILLEQETVSGSGICWAVCKSATRSRQITTPALHYSSFFTGLLAAQPTVSKH